MRSVEEIKAKQKELEEYLQECESRCDTSTSAKHQIEFLAAITSQLERGEEQDVTNAWEFYKTTIGPIYYYDDRKILKQKQEDFYNHNLRGKNCNSKRYQQLWEEYKALDVRNYCEFTWNQYLVLGWIFAENDSHGKPINI